MKKTVTKAAAAMAMAVLMVGVLSVSGCSGREAGSGKGGGESQAAGGVEPGSGSQPGGNGEERGAGQPGGGSGGPSDGDGQPGGSGSGQNNAVGQMEDVTVILDYVANTNHTGMYVALDQGYYQEEGLNVRIVEPTEGAAATLVAVGKGDFGISYQEDVTIALTADDPLPVKAVAAVIQHNTSGFATYADKDIQSPRDFEGKVYAGWGGPGEEAVLKAVMAQDGGDFSKLTMVISDGSGFEALKDKADIMWFFEGWDNVKCQLNDFPIQYTPVKNLDERLDYYTPVIIAGEDVLENRPDMVRRFLAATARGYGYAIENPKESAKILQKYAPDYSLEMLTMSQEYLASKYAENSERWGVMKDEVWDNYTGFMVEYGVIDKAVPANECYTNEFLP